MEPITLAVVTSAVTSLATEVAKGSASEIGKDVWLKIKSWFGMTNEPSPQELPRLIAQNLQQNPELAAQIVQVLQSSKSGTASYMVGTINADKVVSIGTMTGNIQM